MTSHRFGIGEGVTYSERRFPTGIWIAELIVVEQLSRDGAPGYRLLAQDGATEYVLLGNTNSVHRQRNGMIISHAGRIGPRPRSSR